MDKKDIHLFCGLPYRGTRRLKLEPEAQRFSRAFDINSRRIKVHDLLGILDGDIPIPELPKMRLAIIGGSPRSIMASNERHRKREEDLIEALLKSSKKIIGTCFGWQLLARVLQGDIGLAEPTEKGFRQVEFIKNHPILEGVSNPCWVSTFHNHAVHSLPPDFETLTRNEGSGIQMAIGQVNGVWVCGTIFHPEGLTNHPANLLRQLPQYNNGRVCLDTGGEPVEGSRICRNFLAL